MMMKSGLRIVYLTAALTLPMMGCHFLYDDKTLGPDSNPPTFDIGQPTFYSEVHEKVLARRCVGCHSARGGNLGRVNLENYAEVVRNLEMVKRTALVDRTMPRGRPLGPEESAILEKWINEGAPDDVISDETDFN